MEDALELLQAGNSEGSLFFKRPGKAWPLFGSHLAWILFLLWFLHTGLDGVMLLILGLLYIHAVLVSMKSYFIDIRFLDSEGQIHFHFRRPAAVYSSCP
jgi:hypothetical protein